MKNNIIKFLSLSVLLLGTLYSCKKGQISGDKNNLILGSYLTTKAKGNEKLDYKQIATSTVSRTFGQYGAPIDQINLYVVFGQNLDPASWKKIKTIPFSDGVVVSVTGAEIATALGIQPKDINTDMTIYSEAVTKDGRKFSMANTPTNYQSFDVYNIGFVWPVTLINYVCPFDNSFYNGTFAIITDEWNDFATGAPITVQPGPSATQITLTLYPAPGVGSNRKNIVINVDPATDSVVCPKQVYGDYPGAPNLSCQGVGTVSNCSGIISLTLEHSDAGGSYGTYKVVMKKN